METDSNDPVAALCTEGMQAEARGDLATARGCFERAWEVHRTDREAAIAAHYVARHQETLEEALRWNHTALERALAAPADEVRDWFASLYINLAWSHERLGHREVALEYLRLGERALGSLPKSRYAAVVRAGLSRLRQRLSASDPA